MKKISSSQDLQSEERIIGWYLGRLRLDAVLIGLREHGERVSRHPFVRAGLASMAIRHCRPPAREPSLPTARRTLSKLAHRVALYPLRDPITFDEELHQEFVGSNLAFLVLRHLASQQPFYGAPYGTHIRPLVLYGEVAHSLVLPPGVTEFPLDERFRQTTEGVGLDDFIRVGFVAHVAAAANQGFTMDYFRQARAIGVQLPDDEVVAKVLRQLSADQAQFREMHLQMRNPDRRYAMYDLNPLLARPIIRPWSSDSWHGTLTPRMTAPVPDLIPERLGNGIYHQLFVRFRTDFSIYFGYLFEAYCGRVLTECRVQQQILSEQEIRARCPTWRGKLPDWVWIDGKVAIAFECKATRFTRQALTTGRTEAIDESLKQVRKGLTQLAEFTSARESGAAGLEPFAGLHIVPVLVTADLMYAINSGWFREHIDAQLKSEGVTPPSWFILSIAELEALQPHSASGLRLDELITRWAGLLDAEAEDELKKQTGKSAEDSFLNRYYEELLSALRGGATH